MPGGGLTLNEETRVVSLGPATKITEAAQSSRELTVEAWVRPAHVEQQGPARIVTVSDGPQATDRNFSLNQGRFNETPQNRAKWTARGSQASGLNDLSTANATAGTSLHHVVFTHNANTGEARLFVDGVESAFSQAGGHFEDWKAERPLVLGNENTLVGSGRFWVGEFHLVALYNAALTALEVKQNFEAGANPPPALSVSLTPSDAGQHLTLSWPSSAQGFVLETTSSLAAPSWSVVPDIPEGANAKMTLTIPIGQSERFYRLRKEPGPR